jgi:putative heme-binding domain-containing protein
MKLKTSSHKTGVATIISLAVCGGTALGLPSDWEINVFAAPPDAEYPAAISAAANGDVYISSDPNGSLGKDPKFGRIVRATDTTGDGKADQFQDFVPSVSSPRGGHYVGGTFFLIHPPYLSAFRDTTGDGVADEKKLLAEGFGWGIEHPRGADHTTNGVRMGIDGWLYVSVGDFGMPDAKGADGTRYTLQGGGVIRVRPDGSEMEPYAVMIRNICDTAISPTLDMFSRDNTNDGKGWNTRFFHYAPMGDHGYPRLYQNFADETIAPLADYGGGSGTGALYLNEPGFPASHGDSIFTTDWTTGAVYHHPAKPFEATFTVKQEIFHQLPRATDLDVDGSSRLYLADWRNGGFKHDPKQQVGMIHRVLPPGWKARPFPDLKKMDDATLVKQVGSDSAVMRLEAQREILARGKKPLFARELFALAGDRAAHLYPRVAAIFTFKQLYGAGSTKYLVELAGDADVREFALRALADRKAELKDVPADPFIKGLTDPDPRVQVQALNGLARLGAVHAAPAILAASKTWNLDRSGLAEGENHIVPHVGIKALVALNASSACFAALDDAATRKVALRALQEMHGKEIADGLIATARATTDTDLLESALAGLARLYHQEKPWDLKYWWHTRPDDRGPYYAPVEWEATPRIRQAIEAGFEKIPDGRRSAMVALLARNRLPISQLKLAGMDPLLVALSADQFDPTVLALVVDAAKDKERPWEPRLEAYRSLGKAEAHIRSASRVAVLGAWLEQNAHPQVARAVADFVNETERGDEVKNLVEIAKTGTDPESRVAWQALITVINSPLAKPDSKKLVRARLAEMPMEVGLFLAISDLKASGFDQQIEAGINSDNDKTIHAATAAKNAGSLAAAAGRKVGEMTHEDVTRHAMENQGDIAAGERIYVSQGCLACHAVDQAAVQKGPYLGSSGAKFQRDYLIESILAPNAVVAQGFQTRVFQLTDGSMRMGFVTGEQDGVIELRDIAGQGSAIKRSDVKEESSLPQSMMPAGLGDSLSIEDFTSLIEYLVSLKAVGG